MLPFRDLSSGARLGLMGGGLLALVGAECALLFFLSSRAPAPASTPVSTVTSLPTPAPTEAVFILPSLTPAPNNSIPNPINPSLRPSGGNPPVSNPLPSTNPAIAGLPPAPIPGTGPGPVPGTAPSQTAPNPKLALAASKFDQAGAALKSGDKKRAVVLWEEVVKLAPNDIATRQNLALVYGELKQPKAAIPHARAAVKLSPKDPKTQFQLARLLLATKQPREALAPLKATVALAPQEREGHALLARVLVDMRQPKAALAQWSLLAQQNGKDLEAHLNAAAIANDLLRNPKEAEKWLRRSQSQNPKDPQAPMMLASMLLARRDAKGATTVLKQAVQNAPEAFPLYPALAQALVSAKDRPGAIKALQSGIARIPKNVKGAGETEGRLRVTLGQLYGDGKQTKAARDQFARAAALLPRDPEPLALGALAEIELKNLSGATKLLSGAVALDTKNPRVRRLYAQTLAQNKQWKLADTQFQTYCNSVPRDREALAQWGSVAGALKNPTRESQIWQKLAVLDPKNPQVWEQLGGAQLRANRKRDALKTFQKLSALEPRNIPFALEVARLQTDMGDASGAMGTLKKTLNVRSDFPPMYMMFLQAGDAANQKDEARTYVAQKLAAQPQNGAALSGALKFYDDKKRPEEARALLNAVLFRNPKATLAKNALQTYSDSSPTPATTKTP